MARRCCPDHTNVCSRAEQLFLAAQATVQTKADPSSTMRRCYRKATADRPIDVVEGSYDTSDTVEPKSRRSRQKNVECRCLGEKHSAGCALKTECACEGTGAKDIDRADHEAACNRTLVWVVRVPFTTEAGKAVHADSIRLCMADAARLRYEYAQHKAKIVRVYPLYK